MIAPLIDADRLFQSLIEAIDIPGASVNAALNVDALDQIPYITHQSTISQSGNGPGLWAANLTVTLFIEVTNESFALLQALYAGIHAWEDNLTAIPGVGAVEAVSDLEAFTRVQQGTPMLNKVVTPYVGSFELMIRNH